MKTLVFIFLLVFVTPFNSSAETIYYGDYVSCFYELSNLPEKFDRFVDFGVVPISSKELDNLGQEMRGLNLNYELPSADYDFYVFSKEGLYALKMSQRESSDLDLAMEFHKRYDQRNYAYDFSVLLGYNNAVQKFCYYRDWNEFNVKEHFIAGSCYENGYESIGSTERTYVAEKIDDSYFYKFMYPFLQLVYIDFSDSFIKRPYHGYLCRDSKTVKVSDFFSFQIPESEEQYLDFANALQERIAEFNDVVFKQQCFTACKKLGVIKKRI